MQNINLLYKFLIKLLACKNILVNQNFKKNVNNIISNVKSGLKCYSLIIEIIERRILVLAKY